MRLSLALMAGLLIIGGISCNKRVSSYAVMPDLSLENYVPLEGGTIEWVSMAGGFHVSPLGTSPCLPKSNFHATAQQPATCAVASGSRTGVWAYEILPDQPPSRSSADAAANPSSDLDGVFFMRVGSCDNCAARRKKHSRKTDVNSVVGAEGYPIFCQNNQASVKPSIISANSGTAVTWTATGFSPTTASVTFAGDPNGPCSEGSKLQQVAYPICEVTGPAHTYTYTVTQLTGCANSSSTLTLQVK